MNTTREEMFRFSDEKRLRFLVSARVAKDPRVGILIFNFLIFLNLFIYLFIFFGGGAMKHVQLQ